MTDAAAAIAAAAARLAAAGVPGPAAEARLMLAHALGLPPARLIGWPETEVDDAAAARFEALLAHRLERRPLAQILGRREFWSLDLAVTAATLVPRPDSETLVEAALAAFAGEPPPRRILDLGTGTGCLLLALLREWPEAQGLGIDRDPGAVAVAAANARALGLAGRAGVMAADWRDFRQGGFDLVVSNPPYIPSREIAGLAPEVARWEPRGALDGGPDGLAAYREISLFINALLAPDGVLVVEIGLGQQEAVAALFGGAGLFLAARRSDLAGRIRALVFRTGTP